MDPARVFINEGLLVYILADADDALNQLSFVEQRVRTALLRWAWPAQGHPGAVILREPDNHPPTGLRASSAT